LESKGAASRRTPRRFAPGAPGLTIDLPGPTLKPLD
jgi:hypothetical protein